MTLTSLRNSAVAAAVLFAGLTGAAQATATSIALPTTGSPVGVQVIGTSFDDVFNFSLGSVSGIGAGGASNNVSINLGPLGSFTLEALTFTNVILRNGLGQILSPSSLSFGDHSFNLSASNLAAGDYSLEVIGGAKTPNGGFYAMSLVAQPVPEPGEWAMMLAGLGLVGAVARRRSRAV
jgi:hypothetical protein